jgi:hypothetical protein
MNEQVITLAQSVLAGDEVAARVLLDALQEDMTIGQKTFSIAVLRLGNRQVTAALLKQIPWKSMGQSGWILSPGRPKKGPWRPTSLTHKGDIWGVIRHEAMRKQAGINDPVLFVVEAGQPHLTSMPYEPNVWSLTGENNWDLAQVVSRLWTDKRKALDSSPPLYIG